MEITNELAMRITKRIVKDLDLTIDVDCCLNDDHIYEVVIGLIRYNQRKALAWKYQQNNIDYKCI